MSSPRVPNDLSAVEQSSKTLFERASITPRPSATAPDDAALALCAMRDCFNGFSSAAPQRMHAYYIATSHVCEQGSDGDLLR